MNVAITAPILFEVFTILLILGRPISISIATSSIATTLISLPWDQTSLIVMQKMNSGVRGLSLLVVPLLTLAGNIINDNGIARRLINFAQLLSGRTLGSLAHTNVLANMFPGTPSDSTAVTTFTIGGIMDPMKKENSYDSAFPTCVDIASAPAGPLIPPAGAFIVYSTVAGGVPIPALSMVGYMLGILIGVATMLIACFCVKRHKYSVREKVNASQTIKITLDALPSLLLIVIVTGETVGGIFAATEGMGIRVLYCLIPSLVYRSINQKSFMNILLKNAAINGIILFLISVSSAMSQVMVYTGAPRAVNNVMMSISSNKYMILLMVNLVLLMVEVFLDITPACLIFTPILLPIVQSLGMDLVQFSVALTSSMYMGTMTPSVGSVLLVSCGISKISIEEATKPLLPYVGVLLLVLLLVTYIPETSSTPSRLMELV